MRIFLTATLVTGLAATTALAEPARYELDPTHTTVFFTIDHVGYAGTLGIFGDVAGTFSYDMETQELSDVQVTIKADSLNTFNDARDGHVKNQDFLNVSAFPEITFTADGGQADSETQGSVTGDLTILDQTHPITLAVTLNKAEEYPFGHKRFTLGLSMEGSLLRSTYGMDYGVANALVGDEVAIQIETEAMRME